MAHKYDFYQARSWYQFCEIPNDEEGKFFIKQLRKYLNKGRYKVRVRGQYLNSKKHNWQEHTYGSTLATSTHMRVYITYKHREELEKLRNMNGFNIEAAKSWESKNDEVTSYCDDDGYPRYEPNE